VPIAVGMRAGSHFNVPYRLQEYLPLERIKTINVGGFGARLTALLKNEVEATSLLDPQISMADQLGLRRVIGNTFKTLWVAPPAANRATLDAYFRVLQEADADLERNPASCLPHWHYSIPAEFKDHEWDFARFDVGERFFYAPLERDEFDEILEAAQRWGLDDYMQSRSFEDLGPPGRHIAQAHCRRGFDNAGNSTVSKSAADVISATRVATGRGWCPGSRIH
jgi:hypothetical protein